MRKTSYLLLLITVLFIYPGGLKVSAQTATITRAEFDKTEQPGFEIQYRLFRSSTKNRSTEQRIKRRKRKKQKLVETKKEK